MLRLLSAVGLQLVWITTVSAQANEFNVEGSFFRGSLGYVRSVADNLYVGVEIGAGVPQFDQTLRPEQDAAGSPDFKEIAHVALLVRFARSEHVELDAGVRSAIADCGRALPATVGPTASGASICNRWWDGDGSRSGQGSWLDGAMTTRTMGTAAPPVSWR